MSADSSLAYQYVAPELRVFHGRDSFAALKRELERSKCRRAVIVCGRTIGRSEALASLKGALGELVAGVTTSAREHSPVSGVIEATDALRASDADAVIAIGGGSAAVTSRAATILLAEGKPIADLSTRRLPDGKFESPRLNAPKLPIFVVPTTPSTAFAKAGTAVHADDGARLALFDPKTRARAIFIHPDFVRTAPPQLALQRHAQCLCQCGRGARVAKMRSVLRGVADALRCASSARTSTRSRTATSACASGWWSPRSCAAAERSRAARRSPPCWRMQSDTERMLPTERSTRSCCRTRCATTHL